jgi:hypothetical protein
MEGEQRPTQRGTLADTAGNYNIYKGNNSLDWGSNNLEGAEQQPRRRGTTSLTIGNNNLDEGEQRPT